MGFIDPPSAPPVTAPPKNVLDDADVFEAIRLRRKKEKDRNNTITLQRDPATSTTNTSSTGIRMTPK